MATGVDEFEAPTEDRIGEAEGGGGVRKEISPSPGSSPFLIIELQK